MLPQSYYNRSTLKVAQDLLGCFLVRRFILGGKPSTVKFKIVETEAYHGPLDKASHASRGRTERNGVMFEEPGTIYVYFTYGMHHMLNIVTGPIGYPAAVLIRAVEPADVLKPTRDLRARLKKEFNKKICHPGEKRNPERFQKKNPMHSKCASPAIYKTPNETIIHVARFMEGKFYANHAATRPSTFNLRPSFAGPARLAKTLMIDRAFDRLPVFTKKHGLWIEGRSSEVKPSQIVRAKRIGVDYAGEYKDKLWRFYIKGSEYISRQ